MMHYTIYKTTNLVNSMYYIGLHQTNNLCDNYLGSGKRLKAAIKKYGRENFIKEVIFLCKDEKQMRLAERVLVVPDLETNYNLMIGGEGVSGGHNHPRYGSTWSQEVRNKIRNTLIGRKTGPNKKKGLLGELNPMFGKKRLDLKIYNFLSNPRQNQKCAI